MLKHRLRRALEHRAVRIGGLALLLTLPVLWFLRHLLPHPTYVGQYGDIRCFHFWWTVDRVSVLEYGQLPFWNPYYCGGMVHWANVQSMFLAPTFLVNLLFGPGVGIRAHLVLHYLLGFLGCWVLARHRGLRGVASFAPGVVFVFGANFAERATGHVGFMPFLLLPWLAYALERTRRDARWTMAAGGIIAYAVYAGGPYPFVMFCVYVAALLGVDVVSAAWARLAYRRAVRRDPSLAWKDAPPRWRVARPMVMGALIALVAFSVAALKLGPVIDFLAEYPRWQRETDHLSAWQVWEVFLEAPLTRHRKGYYYVFGEYRNYLGPIAMAAVPLMLLWPRRVAKDYVLVVLFGALMLGNFAWWSPYGLLAQLPVFGSLRVPVRYALLVDLHVALLFGALAQRAQEWRRGVGMGLAVLLVAGCAYDVMSNNNRQHVGFFNTPPEAAPREGPFRQVRGDPHTVHEAPLRNEGHIRCYEPNPIRTSGALQANAPSEVWLANGGGHVSIVEWTPNRITVRARLERAARVLVNMNYHRDWQSDHGAVVEARGLLAVDLPKGTTTVALRYQPRRLWLYGAITLSGLLGCAGWLWRSRRRAVDSWG